MDSDEEVVVNGRRELSESELIRYKKDKRKLKHEKLLKSLDKKRKIDMLETEYEEQRKVAIQVSDKVMLKIKFAKIWKTAISIGGSCFSSWKCQMWSLGNSRWLFLERSSSYHKYTGRSLEMKENLIQLDCSFLKIVFAFKFKL